MDKHDERTPRILICEDDPEIATLLQSLLRQEGLAADIAHTAAEAKRRLMERRYTAMTLDILLPDEEGSVLFDEIRAHENTRELPIIVVSIVADQVRRKLRGSVLNVVNWLNKPFDHARLRWAVQDALRGIAGRKPRILHVEDDSAVRDLVAILAQDIGEVFAAASVAEAKAMLEREDFDLALLDLMLPDGYGMELMPLFNNREPNVPVIVFSASKPRRRRDQERIVAALVKSETGLEQLLTVIRSRLRSS